MKKFLILLCAFSAFIISPAIFIVFVLQYSLNININAFWGAFGILLFFASIKAFKDIEDYYNKKEKEDK